MTDAPVFLAPTTLTEAIRAADDVDTVVIAGGTAMTLMLRERLVEPRRLLWLGRIDELSGVVATEAGVRIGATTTLWDLANDPTVVQRHPMVAVAARSVGNPRVRAVATVGGAVAHADPRQDLLPALLAAGAIVHLIGPDGPRAVPMADGFFRGFLETATDPGELVDSVVLPDAAATGEHYVRYTPVSDGDYPTVSVAARLASDGPTQGRLTVALGGVASAPVLGWTQDDGGVGSGGADVEAVCARVVERIAPFDDARGSADYKSAMAAMWTRRVVERLLLEAA